MKIKYDKVAAEIARKNAQLHREDMRRLQGARPTIDETAACETATPYRPGEERLHAGPQYEGRRRTARIDNAGYLPGIVG